MKETWQLNVMVGSVKNLKERKRNQRKAVKDVIMGTTGKFEYGLHVR